MRMIAACNVAISIACSILHVSAIHASEHVLNQRYCEIILSKSKMHLQVLNTWGLNNCPASLWNALSEDSLKRETGSFFVHMRGPQYFVMDSIELASSIHTETRTIGDLPLRAIAWVEVQPSDIIHGNNPYHEHKIHRHITYTYAANQTIFELIDPTGRVFVMQSYSMQHKKQNFDGLSKLNTCLNLPRNWQFKSGVLKSSQRLVGGSNSIVLHDDYLNTYQLAPHDLL